MVTFLDNPCNGGFYIARVYKDTLLDKVGVQAGDMLYEINNYKVDLYGETNVQWSEDKVPLAAVLNRLVLGEQIQFEVYRKGHKKEFLFDFNLTDPLPIRYMYPDHEKIDYEIIGGMVIMELTLNHIERFESKDTLLEKYKLRENQYESRLIITHIFPHSQAEQARVFDRGDVVREINGCDVKTLQDMRLAVRASQEFLTLKTEDKKFAVLSCKKIVEDEPLLAAKYFYKRSVLIDEIDSIKNIKYEDQE